MTEASGEPDASGTTSRPAGWGEGLLNWLLLVAYSLVQSPVPGVNEPHYLTKARHFWRPEWCAGDLFLESANTHWLFYATLGSLAAVLPLTAAAVVGRLVALGLLAAGWTLLVRRLSGGTLATTASLAAFLMLATLGNWSGEWVVGGVESKVPAYGLGLIGVAMLLDSRILAAGVAIGLAVAFHPLVGGWLTVAVAAAIAWGCVRGEVRFDVPNADWAKGAAAFALCALPGLVPAVSLLLTADPAEAAAATRIQVIERLPHHLNPRAFARADHRLFALLLLLLMVLSPTIRSREWTFWRRTVVASLAIAAVGLLAAAGPGELTALPAAGLRLTVLKFYLFRLADVLVPFTVAVLLARRLPPGGWRRWAIVAATIAASLVVPGVNREAGRLPPDRQQRWLDVCEWVRRETDPHAVFQTYGQAAAFKWHAQRPEYLNFKDMPQDAASLVEWQRRRELVQDWPRRWTGESYSQTALDDLHARTGIDYLITPAGVPFDVPALKQNSLYQVIPTQPVAD